MVVVGDVYGVLFVNVVGGVNGGVWLLLMVVVLMVLFGCC